MGALRQPDEARSDATRPGGAHAHGFEHEALLYEGEPELVEQSTAFIRDGLAAGEPVLVMVGGAKVDRLREALDGDAERVRFVNMEEAGRNPARIIPAWREFATRSASPDRGMRGIGEPIWAGRSAQELVECQTHESLLNVAFADADRFRLLCPYDIATLDADVLEEARRSHPLVSHGPVRWTSASYRPADAGGEGLGKPLPEPDSKPSELTYRLETLPALRARVRAVAAAAGLDAGRASDIVLSVSEIAANSVRHADGHGLLRTWIETDALVCEVRDSGRIGDALVGRVSPLPNPAGGQGLWIVNQLCDLVQVRSSDDGTAVRLHMRRGAAT